MAQETQTRALYQARGVGWGGRLEGSSKGRGYVYTYGQFMLRFDRKQQNSVKQLLFNKKNDITSRSNVREQGGFSFFPLLFLFEKPFILTWASLLGQIVKICLQIRRPGFELAV